MRVLERVKVNKWENENLIRGKTKKNSEKGKFLGWRFKGL